MEEDKETDQLQIATKGFSLEEYTDKALYRNRKKPTEINTWEKSKWNKGKRVEELTLDYIKE